MMLVIGLGNPGPKYQYHRHNVGFHVLDRLVAEHSLYFNERKLFHAEMASMGDTLLLAKPTTFMNESGTVVKMLLKQYDADIAVVYDDIDISIGTVKCSYGRGAGGHNGVQSIIDHTGTKDFLRIRVGVRPVREELLPRIAPPDGFEKFLLSDFTPLESADLEKGIEKAVNIIESLPTMTIEEIMNRYN